MAETTDALCPPLMTRTAKKSPMTSATTKIAPSAIPVLVSGMMMLTRTSKSVAPASFAASMTEGLILDIELKMGTIMNSVNRWTYVRTTAKSENRRNSRG